MSLLLEGLAQPRQSDSDGLRLLNSILRLQRRMIHRSKDSSPRELLLQICPNYFRRDYATNEEKDGLLGAIALGSAMLCDSRLFHEVVCKLTCCFDLETYVALGGLFCLQAPVVSAVE